jgi:hypothetical protein
MKYYGIDSQGLLKIPVVDTLPVWSSSYERRIIYNEEDEILYYGTSTDWSRVIEHTHTNKSVLDKLLEVDGNLNFDGNLIGGVLTIGDDYTFDTTILRDAYFVTNPDKLVNQLFVIVSPSTLYQYRINTWVDVTPIIRGETGPIGCGNFTINAVGPLTEKDLYDTELSGFSFLAVDTQQLYIRWGDSGVWGGPYDFPNLNSCGIDDWEKFPGYYLETLFDNPVVGTITENLKLSLNDAIFATRVTVENIVGFVTNIVCPSLSINRQNSMIVTDTSTIETIIDVV